jgi:hypothetical protein
MKKEIPTAEEFTKTLLKEVANCKELKAIRLAIEKHFIEFAKLHIQSALKAASEKAEIKMDTAIFVEGVSSTYVINKESILNAYSLDLI